MSSRAADLKNTASSQKAIRLLYPKSRSWRSSEISIVHAAGARVFHFHSRVNREEGGPVQTTHDARNGTSVASIDRKDSHPESGVERFRRPAIERLLDSPDAGPASRCGGARSHFVLVSVRPRVVLAVAIPSQDRRCDVPCQTRR